MAFQETAQMVSQASQATQATEEILVLMALEAILVPRAMKEKQETLGKIISPVVPVVLEGPRVTEALKAPRDLPEPPGLQDQMNVKF